MSHLPQIKVTNGFKKAVAWGNSAALGAASGTWDATDFQALLGLWAILKETGTSKATTDGGMIRTIDKDGVNEFIQTLTMTNAELLLQPRQADGTPVADLVNFPVWIEPTDLQADVPDGMPHNTTSVTDEETGDVTVTPIKWADYDPANRGRTYTDFDGRKVLRGSFNRRTLNSTETLWDYLQLAEAGHFTLLSTVEFHALVAANQPIE